MADEEDIPMAHEPDADLNDTQPHDNDDSGSAHGDDDDSGTPKANPSSTTPAGPPEEAPPEKPFSGFVAMQLPGLHGVQQVRVADPGLPSWLRSVLADDVYYFRSAVLPSSKHPTGEGAGDDPETADAAAAAAQGDGESAVERCSPNDVVFIRQTRDGAFVLLSHDEDDAAATASVAATPSPAVANAAAAAGDGDDDADGPGENESPERATQPAAPPPPVAAAPQVQLLTFTVDYLTLAAAASTECLSVMLRMPHVSADRLVGWVLSVGVERASDLLQTLCHAKQLATPAGESTCTAKIATSLDAFFVGVAADARQHSALSSLLCLLVNHGFSPKAPLNCSTKLATADAVWLYLQLLLNIPKSVLLSWTLPPVAEGDDPVDDEARKAKPVSYALGALLLDARRRAARERNGKAPLRESAHSAARKALPKTYRVEQGDDTVVTRLYSEKTDGSLPLSLTLYQSDLVLLLLGTSRSADLMSLFEEILVKRMVHPNRQSITDRAGMWHLLYSHLHQLRSDAVATLFRLSPSKTLFVRGGLARIDDFTARFLLEYDGRFSQTPEACEEAVYRNHQFLATYAKPFAARFWPEIAQDVRTMVALERQGNSFLSFIHECLAVARRIEEAVDRNDDAADHLPQFVAGDSPAVLPSTVFTPELMHRAIEAHNVGVVRFLAEQHGIVTCQCRPLGGEVDLVEEAVRRRDVRLLEALIRIGASLNAPLFHGLTSGLAALQDSRFVAKDDTRQLLVETWMDVEKNRIADPERNHGLLLGLRRPIA